jgi:hypothetical protein
MKKFESIDEPLFAPLAAEQQRRVTAGDQTNVISLIHTNDPNPDETIDHV